VVEQFTQYHGCNISNLIPCFNHFFLLCFKIKKKPKIQFPLKMLFDTIGPILSCFTFLILLLPFFNNKRQCFSIFLSHILIKTSFVFSYKNKPKLMLYLSLSLSLSAIVWLIVAINSPLKLT